MTFAPHPLPETLSVVVETVRSRVPMRLRGVSVVVCDMPDDVIAWANELSDGSVRVELSPAAETLPAPAAAYVIAHELAHIDCDHAYVLQQVAKLPPALHEAGQVMIEAAADAQVLAWGFVSEVRAFEAWAQEEPAAGSDEWWNSVHAAVAPLALHLGI